jgi:hypothetical protein
MVLLRQIRGNNETNKHKQFYGGQHNEKYRKPNGERS